MKFTIFFWPSPLLRSVAFSPAGIRIIVLTCWLGLHQPVDLSAVVKPCPRPNLFFRGRARRTDKRRRKAATAFSRNMGGHNCPQFAFRLLPEINSFHQLTPGLRSTEVTELETVIRREPRRIFAFSSGLYRLRGLLLMLLFLESWKSSLHQTLKEDISTEAKQFNSTTSSKRPRCAGP
jgi:hypothetical protein